MLKKTTHSFNTPNSMSYGVENYELSQEKPYVNVISPKRRTSTEKKINGTN